MIAPVVAWVVETGTPKAVISESTLPEAVDAVFIALHGGYGENGGIQADLDALAPLRLPVRGGGLMDLVAYSCRYKEVAP